MADTMILRITVEDIITGHTASAEIPAGEYFIVTTEPCYVSGTQAYPRKGTHVIVVKGRTAR